MHYGEDVMIVHMQCFVHVLSSDLTVVWFGEKGLCKQCPCVTGFWGNKNY